MQCILLGYFQGIFMEFIKLVMTLTNIPHVELSCAMVAAFSLSLSFSHSGLF